MDDDTLAFLVRKARLKAAWYHNRWPWYPVHDLYSESLYGLTVATRRYESTSGVPFIAYALQCMTWQLLEWHRLNARTHDQCRHITVAWGDYDDGGQWEAKTGATVMAASLLQQLNARDQAMLRAYFWEGRGMGDIAKDYGLTEGGISRALKQALKRLRRFATQQGAPQ